MHALIENFKAEVACRYLVTTKATPDGLLIECLDFENNLLMSRKLSNKQVKNRQLLETVIGDLRSQLRLN